jgi:hypothetical protein
MSTMKTAIGLLAALAAIPQAFGQGANERTGDQMDRLRACSALAPAERLPCLEALSRDIAPPSGGTSSGSTPAAPEPAAEEWIVSQTTSPLDYSPIAVASAMAKAGPDGAFLQLSIQCRGGRTELVLTSPSLVPQREDYAVSYSINGAPPILVLVAAAQSGTGLAIKGDVVQLLTSLPERGQIAFRAGPRQGRAVEGRYALPGLKSVVNKLAAPCNWRVGGSSR